MIAGAMDDGHLNIWDVDSILADSPHTALITSNQTHRGAIRVVEFNPVTPKILLSAGQGGEVVNPLSLEVSHLLITIVV